MKKLISLFFAGVMFCAIPAMAQEKTKMVGGAAMFPTKNIIQNAVNSKDHTTLVAAVKQAGLVETLESKGPFTVFAPTNSAFNMLPAGTVDHLLMAEQKAALAGILTYHVVAGKISSAALLRMIKKGNGTAELKTVAGGMLYAMRKGKTIMLKDEWILRSKFTTISAQSLPLIKDLL